MLMVRLKIRSYHLGVFNVVEKINSFKVSFHG